MKDITALTIFLIAIVIAAFTVFGGESLTKLTTLREGLQMQRVESENIKGRVMELRREVNGLQNDDRILEKAARNELGMARQGELIFLFDSHVSQEAGESLREGG